MELIIQSGSCLFGHENQWFYKWLSFAHKTAFFGKRSADLKCTAGGMYVWYVKNRSIPHSAIVTKVRGYTEPLKSCCTDQNLFVRV